MSKWHVSNVAGKAICTSGGIGTRRNAAVVPVSVFNEMSESAKCAKCAAKLKEQAAKRAA